MVFPFIYYCENCTCKNLVCTKSIKTMYTLLDPIIVGRMEETILEAFYFIFLSDGLSFFPSKDSIGKRIIACVWISTSFVREEHLMIDSSLFLIPVQLRIAARDFLGSRNKSVRSSHGNGNDTEHESRLHGTPQRDNGKTRMRAGWHSFVFIRRWSIYCE